MAGNVVQYPPYEGIPIADGVNLPPGFVLAFPLSVGYPVVKGSIHIPLNQIELLIGEEVLRFTDVNRETAKHCRQGSTITRLTNTKFVASACSKPPTT